MRLPPQKILLTFFSLSALLLLFVLPANRKWFNIRIIGYWNDFRTQRHQPDLEQRKIKRWGNSYTISKKITDTIASKGGLATALVLIPPTDYFRARAVTYHVPEPAVFYYFTGLKTTWINSSQAWNANWMVLADHGTVRVVPVYDKKVFYDSMEKFKKYPVRL